MKNKSFSRLAFVAHVKDFLSLHRLHRSDKKIAVAVSGGVDSIALMYVLYDIFGSKIKVIHVNHGTRPECQYEEELVIAHAKLCNMEIDIHRYNLSLSLRNFESVARNIRANIFKKYIDENFWVFTAHHIDDSFEWSLIQSLRQNRLESTLGIPLFNHGLVRPFMCVTKSQIIQFAKLLNLQHASDSSNLNVRFERNYVRLELIPPIKIRYAQFLRHYVSLHNQLALKLNLHRFNDFNRNQIATHSHRERRESSGCIVLKSKKLFLQKDFLREWLHFFSHKKRGEIDRELEKLLSSHREMLSYNNSYPFKGPLDFSGGVKVFMMLEYVMICSQSQIEHYQNIDDKLLKALENKTSEITFGAKFKKSHLTFPYLTLLQESLKGHTSKVIHPLLPKTTAYLKANKIPYNFYPVLKRKKIPNLNQASVLLDSSLFDL